MQRINILLKKKYSIKIYIKKIKKKQQKQPKKNIKILFNNKKITLT